MGARIRGFAALVVASGCAASSPPSRPAPAASPAPSVAVSTPSANSRPPTRSANATAETPASIFERSRPELVKCYEEGRRAVPTMLDGRLTLNVALDGAGKASCVIPTDDTGLTQEVEDCMSARLMSTAVTTAGSGVLSIPVSVRGGAVAFDATPRPSGGLGLDSVETHRMPDAFDAIEELLPVLQACVRGQERSSASGSMVVAARVRTDGVLQCSLATASSGALAREVSDCATNALRAARFPAPKGGAGLVLVPIRLSR